MDRADELDKMSCSLGLDPVVNTVDRRWSGELPLEGFQREIMLRAQSEIVSEHGLLAIELLLRLPPDAFDPISSAQMRREYWMGLAWYQIARKKLYVQGVNEYQVALDHFRNAWTIALKGTDYPSLSTILRMQAEIEHILMRYDDALDDFRSSLINIECHPPKNPIGRAQAKITLYGRLARALFIVKHYHEALDAIHIARRIRGQIGAAVTTERDRGIEDWLECLIIRNLGLMSNGDIKMLTQASRKFKKVEKRLYADPTSQGSYRRLLILQAETHLDLAEAYRNNGNEPSFLSNMKMAERYASKAAQSLATQSPNDVAGKDVMLLVVLRHQLLSYTPHQIMSLAAYIRNSTTNGFNDAFSYAASQLYDIECRAAAANDYILLARAASMRADLLLTVHDLLPALHINRCALNMLEIAGARGEGARIEMRIKQIYQSA